MVLFPLLSPVVISVLAFKWVEVTSAVLRNLIK